MQDQENLSDCNVQRIIEEGEDAKAMALEYIDWLVTTYNESSPDESCIPVPHPCSVPPCDVTKLMLMKITTSWLTLSNVTLTAIQHTVYAGSPANKK